MKKWIAVFMIVLSPSVMADMNDLSISGHILGGGFGLKQEEGAGDNQRRNFEMAVNLDFDIQLTEEWGAFVQLQSSPGESSLGFPGSGVEVTDLSIQYHPKDSTCSMILGSFDTPFGLQVSQLSNNADTTNNSMIMNDVMYSQFAGAMGTLNTVGVMGTYDRGPHQWILAVSNGTNESSDNADNGFETVLSYSVVGVLPSTTIGASVLQVHDKQGYGQNTDVSSFNANVMAWIVDLQTTVFGLDFDAYFANLDYGDDNAQTKDGVMTYMGQIKKSLDWGHIAVRYSEWHPEDDNADGQGLSQALNQPVGFASGTVRADQKVSRIQLGVGYQLEENVLFKTEFFIDDYGKETLSNQTDVMGAMAFVNVSF